MLRHHQCYGVKEILLRFLDKKLMNALRTNGKIHDILKVLEYYQVIIGELQFHLLFGLPIEPRGVRVEHSGWQILRD